MTILTPAIDNTVPGQAEDDDEAVVLTPDDDLDYGSYDYASDENTSPTAPSTTGDNNSQFISTTIGEVLASLPTLTGASSASTGTGPGSGPGGPSSGRPTFGLNGQTPGAAGLGPSFNEIPIGNGRPPPARPIHGHGHGLIGTSQSGFNFRPPRQRPHRPSFSGSIFGAQGTNTQGGFSDQTNNLGQGLQLQTKLSRQSKQIFRVRVKLI